MTCLSRLSVCSSTKSILQCKDETEKWNSLRRSLCNKRSICFTICSEADWLGVRPGNHDHLPGVTVLQGHPRAAFCIREL